MRPALALYVGGMGSRQQNFYNALVREYGFEEAAAEIQDLYLDGKREEACRAVPDELIDLVSLVGSARKGRRAARRLSRRRGRHAARLAARLHPRAAVRAAAHARGARRLSRGGRREPAELTSPSGSSGSSSAPSASRATRSRCWRSGERLVQRGHQVTYETWERWREHVVAAGMEFVPAPEYPVFPTPERAAQALRGGRPGDRADPSGDRGPAAGCGGARHPHARPRAGGRARGNSHSDARSRTCSR